MVEFRRVARRQARGGQAILRRLGLAASLRQPDLPGMDKTARPVKRGRSFPFAHLLLERWSRRRAGRLARDLSQPELALELSYWMRSSAVLPARS